MMLVIALRTSRRTLSTAATLSTLPALLPPLRASSPSAWGILPLSPLSDALQLPPANSPPAPGAYDSGELDPPPMLAIKRTYQPSVIRKKRKHGFLTRNSTTAGRRMLARRRNKGRRTIAC